ncbi:glycosyltransferase [Glutamicibacter arilaitensis]|uniref:glycosyltransferase n=1 Tax=Glutamicibacter arilaitensis TaxID=256701 RepID=UPI003FCFEB08
MNVESEKNGINAQTERAVISSVLKFNEILSTDLSLLSKVLRAENEKYKNLHKSRSVRKDHSLSVPSTEVQQGSFPRDLKIAAIMDEFTSSAFTLACDLLLPNISTWEEEIHEFSPDFLLVESAWQGNNGSWEGQIHKVSPELLKLISWCETNKVPTVFWNKEDPVHFDSFVATASLFQYIFTTDLESIERYKKSMQHNNVFLMPFFCEPQLHSPIPTVKRKPGASFAGAYYHRYPERSANFETIISSLDELLDVVIYDRNYGENKPEFEFPEEFQHLIKGKLDFRDIDISYKGYEFGINLNSVKQSPSMFARRAFDLILSNTHVVSNYSKGLRLLFGDLVTSSDHSADITQNIRALVDSNGSSATLPYAAYVRHRALQKVLREHTTSARLKYISEKIWTKTPSVFDAKPSIDVLGFASNESDVKSLIRIFESQDYEKKKMFIYSSKLNSHDVRGLPRGVEIILSSSDVNHRMSLQSDYVAVLNPDKVYAKDYLSNSICYMRLGDFDGVVRGISKGDPYSLDSAFTIVTHGNADSGVFKSDYVRPLLEPQGPLERIVAPELLCIPNFDLSSTGDEISSIQEWEKTLDVGISMDRILELAEGIPMPDQDDSFENGFKEKSLQSLFEPLAQQVSKIDVKATQQGIHLKSVLETTEHRYVYGATSVELSSISLSPGNIFSIHAIMTPGLSSSVVVLMFDDTDERLDAKILTVNSNHSIEIPSRCKYLKLGLRVQGAGSSILQGISFEPLQEKTSNTPILSRKKNLVLTNVYPSADNLYRNGFVHSRVRRYQEAFIDTSVFTLNPKAAPVDYTFEGIDVHVGGEDELRRILTSNEFDSVLVHFLDERMWKVLRDCVSSTRILIWVHGAEVQPWYRRDFNYSTEQERDKAKASSNKRISLWKEVLNFPHPNIHYVFVSDYFYHEVMEDTEASLQKWQYSIIHNFIDSDIFNYEKKSADKRFKVLSIRPYASRKYANDLSVETVRLLSSHPSFMEAEFLFVGDGPLFDAVLEPIRDYPNVTIRRSFLSQHEISALHDQFGIFLTPTRMDSQGVSRDEAMSSGLVPVTTGVTAIPEFVDENCGILARAESSSDMADGIARLWDNSELFAAMSENASLRARSQCSFEATIGAEVNLIQNQ